MFRRHAIVRIRPILRDPDIVATSLSSSNTNTGGRVAVKQINGFIGAELSGVDLGEPLSDEAFRLVHDAFVKHEVIVLKNQNITLDQQIAFGKRFGELLIHPFGPKKEGHRDVILYDHHEANPPALTDVWHSDETYRECPPMATMLRCLAAPATGGDTLFASMTAAYRGLSEPMKQYLHTMEALHDFKPFRQLFSAPELKGKLRAIDDQFPNPWHPVIRVHPITGKRAIFVNPQFTIRIKALKNDESDAILAFLYSQALRAEFQLRVKWEPNMIVMWDNRSTQHYVSYDFYPQRRVMERLTIAGDRPFGPQGPYTPESLVEDPFVPKSNRIEAPKRDFELY